LSKQRKRVEIARANLGQILDKFGVNNFK